MTTPPTPPDRDYVIVDSRKGCLYYAFLTLLLMVVAFTGCAVLPFLVPTPDEGAKLEEPAEEEPTTPGRTWIKREGIK